ncbi:MAG: hypothetical protein LQ342_006767 [Letrouitia transgressa]|nr:MAG: hypothetical protein LQ342_006767 [Letrouitia transgressa]
MVSTRSQSNIATPRLDVNSPVKLDYLAEGAANVIFSINSLRFLKLRDEDCATNETSAATEDSQPKVDIRFKGKVLRLKKSIPSAVPVPDAQRKYEELIKPLFTKESIVEQVLCEVSEDLLKQCNSELKRLEKTGFRTANRRGIYLDESEQYGTLITDMTPDDQHASADVKLKWLIQSPSAPADAQRCRTCAMRARRRARATVEEVELGDFCPLVLTDESEKAFSAALEPMLNNARGAPLYIPQFVDKIRPFLHKSYLLQRLRELQTNLDKVGPLMADTQSQDFLLAMTLRDCTLFLKIPNQDVSGSKGQQAPDAVIEARLGDLDVKSPSGGKAEYWKKTEQSLIDEGWYTCTEQGSVKETICLLASTS